MILGHCLSTYIVYGAVAKVEYPLINPHLTSPRAYYYPQVSVSPDSLLYCIVAMSYFYPLPSPPPKGEGVRIFPITYDRSSTIVFNSLRKRSVLSRTCSLEKRNTENPNACNCCSRIISFSLFSLDKWIPPSISNTNLIHHNRNQQYRD